MTRSFTIGLALGAVAGISAFLGIAWYDAVTLYEDEGYVET